MDDDTVPRERYDQMVRFLTTHCGSRCTVEEHERLFDEWQREIAAPREHPDIE